MLKPEQIKGVIDRHNDPADSLKIHSFIATSSIVYLMPRYSVKYSDEWSAVMFFDRSMADPQGGANSLPKGDTLFTPIESIDQIRIVNYDGPDSFEAKELK